MLVAAFLASRSCGATNREITVDEAIELARTEASFEPCAQNACDEVRFVQRGIPPRGFWLVGLAARLDAEGRPIRTESFLVDVSTGDIIKVN